MALQESVAVRNATLDSKETTIGTAPHLHIRTGAAPVDCAAADSGTLLVNMTLPSDWMNNAAAGSKTKLGTWTGTGLAAGTAGHWRIKESTETTTHLQGAIPADMTLDNAVIAVGQAVTVNTFTLNAGNA